MLGWVITIVIAYILFIIAFKLDNKYNDGDFRDDVEDFWGVVLICMVVPFINIILGLFLIGFIIYVLIKDKIEDKGVYAEDIMKKIFFIKERK